MQFFATAAKGTEGALRDELREHRFRGVRATRGGVSFEGDWDEGARACLELRIAIRVLAQLADVPAETADALYEGVRGVDWSPFASPERTLAVRVAGTTRGLVHTQFSARRTKDAIVDQLRERRGARPSVDVDDPDLSVFVHLANERAVVYADVGGESLHRRGYRTRIGAAPLKETLAAAILRLSGWDRRSPLLDPMCGSGTLLIEAALWARDVAPGLLRSQVAIERWPLADDALRHRLKDQRDRARSRVRDDAPPFFGIDLDPDMITISRANANAAGVSLVLKQGDARALEASRERGTIVTNPPYGERLEGGVPFYRALATSLARYEGSTLALLAGTPELRRAFGEPTKWYGLANGPIPCELLLYAQGRATGRQ